MLLRLEDYRKPEISRLGGCWDAYIRMRGLREFYEQLRARIAVSSELTKRPYGDSEFEVHDPNAYVLVFRRNYRLNARVRFSRPCKKPYPERGRKVDSGEIPNPLCQGHASGTIHSLDVQELPNARRALA